MKGWVLLSSLAFAAAAHARPLRIDPPSWLHCQSDAVRDCSAANGRVDAAALAARKRYVLFVAGGPAWPQAPIQITVDELNRVGIGAWFTGDYIEAQRTAYIEAFNDAMEKAFTAQHGPRVLHDVRARTGARIQAAEAGEARRRP
jgi:hypothetical protein